VVEVEKTNRTVYRQVTILKTGPRAAAL